MNMRRITGSYWSGEWNRVLLSFIPLAFALFSAPTAFGQTVPLKTYWHSGRNDNFTTATAVGEQSAVGVGYQFIRIEGYVFPTQQPGTVPLKLYWSGARNDNFTTATAAGDQAAQGAGYQLIRVEGYVYPTQQTGTVPLKLFWSAARNDNFTTATFQGEQDAKAAGYQFVSVEGYVFATLVSQLCQTVDCSPPPPPPPQPKIERLSWSSASPGSRVAVSGSGFGATPGRLFLAIGSAGIDLIDLDWHDTYVIGWVPPDLTGWPDITMTVYVRTQGGQLSNGRDISFHATRVYIELPPRAAQVVACSTNASVNDCAWLYGPMYARHWESFLGHGGTDVYSATLKNGWVFADMRFSTSALGFMVGDWATVKGFSKGSASATLVVEWGTSFMGGISYGIRLFIEGPKGVSYQ